LKIRTKTKNKKTITLLLQLKNHQKCDLVLNGFSTVAKPIIS